MTDMRADSIAPVILETTSEERERRDEPSGAFMWSVVAFAIALGTILAFGIYQLTTLN
jgi:hypothetical protein